MQIFFIDSIYISPKHSECYPTFIYKIYCLVLSMFLPKIICIKCKKTHIKCQDAKSGIWNMKKGILSFGYEEFRGKMPEYLDIASLAVSIQKNCALRSTFWTEIRVFCEKEYLCKKITCQDTHFAKKGILFVKFFSIDTQRVTRRKAARQTW